MAAYGCVIPKKENEVHDMLKLAFPVSANKTKNILLCAWFCYLTVCLSLGQPAFWNMLLGVLVLLIDCFGHL